MIVDTIVSWLLSMVGPVLALLPAIDLSGFVSVCVNSSGAAGGFLGTMNLLFPVTETVTILDLLVQLMGAMAIYTGFKWIWRHIPTLWGFGTGNA